MSDDFLNSLCFLFFVLPISLVQEPVDEGLPVLETGRAVEASIEGSDFEVHTPTLDTDYKNAPTVGVCYQIKVEESGPYHIDLRSYAFDAYLVLRDSEGNLLVEDDDGLIGVHSRLVADLEAGVAYLLTACALHGDRGQFQLSFTAGAPAALDAKQRRAAEKADTTRRLAWIEQKHGSESLELANALNSIGASLWKRGQYAEAEPLLERALAVQVLSLGSEHHAVALSSYNLAGIYRRQGRYAEAESLHERALAIWEQAPNPENRAVAMALRGLAAVYSAQGRYADSEPLYKRALAIQESLRGSEHPSVATILGNLAQGYHAQGRYAESESLHKRALEVMESSRGSEHPTVATILNNLAVVYGAQDRYAEAEPLFKRAIAIQERSRGSVDPGLAGSLSSLAGLYYDQGRYAESEPLYKRAIAIWEAKLGPNHPSVVEGLNNLARLYKVRGRSAEAERLSKRALAIGESSLGTEHPLVAQSLHNLAEIYRGQRRYAETESLHKRALAIRELTLDPEHRDVAMSLHNLALFYKTQGRYAEAEPLYKRAIAIHELLFGPESSRISTSLSNLAAVYFEQGRYAEAEPLFNRVLAIKEASLGSEHSSVAFSLDHLALLYHAQGRYAESESLHKRALRIWETSLGPRSSSVAYILNNLAGLYTDQGRYTEAESLYKRALAIRDPSHNSKHPSVASILQGLAMVYRIQGRYEEAEPLCKRALAIRESLLGSEHPDVATHLNNLAVLYDSQGRYAESEPLFKRALAIRESSLGSEHPSVAQCLVNLSVQYHAQGRWAESEPLCERALRGTLDYLDRELPVQSEADRFRLLSRSHGPLGVLMTTTMIEREDAAHLFDLCLEWKGKVTRLQAASLALSQRENDPEVRAKIGKLQGLQQQLAELVMLPQSAQAANHSERIEEIRNGRLAIERELNRELGFDEMLATPTSRELQAAMPSDSVLLDFYVSKVAFVWVLHPTGDPKLIELGEPSALRSRKEFVLLASTARGEAGLPSSSNSEVGLSGRLWEPLRDAVGKARTVFVSPDGFLCELPFGVLRDGEGNFLLEKHRFVYLSDATRLVLADEATEDREGPVLAIGDVDYFQANEIEAEDLQELVVASRPRSPIDDRWDPLPGTLDELRSIRNLHEQVLRWDRPIHQLSGTAATEEAMRRSIVGQRYVHIATHGYFEPDHFFSSMRNAEEEPLAAQLGDQSEVVGLLPGLLSGLVFAGANADPDPSRDDGYLSAEEIQHLDLSACDLAVLSACDTSLGSKRAGHGLMSLRRAFEVAGAKTVISSLWEADDKATAKLMKWFYENYWQHGMEKGEALHQAKLRMLHENRAGIAGDARPSTWGAFVLSGDWK